MFIWVFILKACNTAVQGSEGVVAPCIIEIDNAEEITEQFGPILHILRFTNERFPSIISTINTVNIAYCHRRKY